MHFKSLHFHFISFHVRRDERWSIESRQQRMNTVIEGSVIVLCCDQYTTPKTTQTEVAGVSSDCNTHEI